VIRGDTDHYEHIAREAAAGLAAVAREKAIPVGFGVLTVGDAAQAQVRSAADDNNKGGEAARAALAMAVFARKLRA
jgi:6,7-dimethyl-8-ribityllumazine synthase